MLRGYPGSMYSGLSHRRAYNIRNRATLAQSLMIVLSDGMRREEWKKRKERKHVVVVVLVHFPIPSHSTQPPAFSLETDFPSTFLTSGAGVSNPIYSHLADWLHG